MQYRRDLVPHPLGIRHQSVGVRLPRVTPGKVPYERNKRLISIERAAAENGAEAMHGLGVIDGSSMKARKIDGRLDHRMLFVGNRPIVNQPIPLGARPAIKIRQGVSFRDVSLQGLGDGPVPGSNNAGFWSELNTALSTPQVNALVAQGANFYVQREASKDAQTIASQQAKTAALQAQLAQQRAALATSSVGGTPSWVIPAVAVGGVALVGLFFLAKRK